MRVLGIDYGARRIGLALSDATATLASPWRMLQRPPSEAETMRVLIAGFVVFVAFLGIFGAMRGLNGRGTGGAVFPEAMTAFSLSAFAALAKL